MSQGDSFDGRYPLTRAAMRDVNRIRPLMERLIAAWEGHPDLRLGQIVSNASPHRDSYSIEDEALVRAIERQLGVISVEEKRQE